MAFPVVTNRIYSELAFGADITKYISPLPWYTLNFFFWILGIFAVLLFFKNGIIKRQAINVILLVLFGWLLMVIYQNTGNNCELGYPVSYKVVCEGLEPMNGPAWLWALVNYLYWFVVGAVSLSTLVKVYTVTNKALRILGVPLVLTSLSLVVRQSCSGFLCFTPSGSGFPIAFWNHNTFGFEIVSFGIDYIFWLLVSIGLSLGIKLLRSF